MLRVWVRLPREYVRQERRRVLRARPMSHLRDVTRSPLTIAIIKGTRERRKYRQDVEGEIIAEEKSAQTSMGFGHLSGNNDLGKDSLSGAVAVEVRAGCREIEVREVETVRHACTTVSSGLAETGER